MNGKLINYFFEIVLTLNLDKFTIKLFIKYYKKYNFSEFIRLFYYRMKLCEVRKLKSNIIC